MQGDKKYSGRQQAFPAEVSMNILVVGRAKTGTTVISKTIANSLPRSIYHLEPKHPKYFLCGGVDVTRTNIVKLIHEHWDRRPRCRNALIHGELDIVFDKTVFILRDPRDELISRLLYVIYPWTAENGFDGHRLGDWLAVLKSKERAPRAVSFLDIVEELDRIYGVRFLGQNSLLPYLACVEAAPKNSHVVRYEAFLQDRIGELEEYLGFSLTISRDVGDLKRTRRSISFDNWKHFFTERDVDYFRTNFGAQIERYGYTDWALSRPASLDSALYSDYVERLARSV